MANMKSLRIFAACFALSLAATALGCRSFVPATPPGFVELEDRYGSQEYRATTADGVVIGVRAYDNEPKGERAFWVKVLENRMRDAGGYALLEKREVVNRGGLTGTQLRFGHDEGDEPFLYNVTVFVTDKRIFLVESGGPRAQVERLSDQLDWSVKNFLQR